jgi:hypothetical protein
MAPELAAALVAAAGLALLVTAGRMEAATIPPTEPTEGTDDGAQALPAEDL